ncbi:MAG: hypothetical protein JWL90_1537 [Chthoniobacteraceae bacterium]|nr:hypothetical protein [Chthoniobacteraceae bacterium]
MAAFHSLFAAEVPNFTLLDYNGAPHELHRADGRAVVLFFTGIGCPVARKNAGKLVELKKQFGPEVTVWMVDSEAGVDRDSARNEAQELGVSDLPCLLDGNQALALALGVERTAETIVIDAKEWSVIYRGALDDQFSEGNEKAEPGIRFAALAVAAHLGGNPVLTARTPVKGCLISYEKTATQSGELISYSKQIAPILQKHCVDCHSEGDIGPFAFSSYNVVKRKARMIEEVLLTQRMPPWHADPHYGKFANDVSIAALDVQTLLGWIRQGAPRDEEKDPLSEPLAARPDWQLGAPDYIIKLPQPEQIPATGVLNYRHIKLDSPVPEDAWLAATVVRPGNRKVLHHAIVYAKFEGSGDEPGGTGVKIAGWAPGRQPRRLPEGTGIFLGKGAKLDIELHYTTNGTPQTDQTEIGLYLLREKPKSAYKTGMAIKLDFSIPANDPNAQTSAAFVFQRDSFLYALTPHMHVRGSWMKYEAQFPDGRRETLLSVPRFDFNWQTSYGLAKPLRMPAGTKIICTGAFDNSVKNLSNPDPNKVVHWGQQSWDEMFIGYVGYVEVPVEPACDK